MTDDEINDVFRFRTFPVYNDARALRKSLKQYTKQNFPKEEQYNLTSQLWRALDSIVLNIAEGSNRYTGKDNSRFMNISIGSTDEVASCIDCAHDDEYMDKDTQMRFLGSLVSIMKQLRALSASIRKSNRQN